MTVVERSTDLRVGGQAVDIRGVALDVVDRMGLLDDARRLRTRMRGMSVLDGSGGRLDGDDIELLRDDLSELLYQYTRDSIEYVFGDSVAALVDTGASVNVEFERGAPRVFDLVVGADGLHSAVRRLAFGPEERFLRPMGTQLAIAGIDNVLGLDDWQVWLREGDVGFGTYPVRDNTELRVTFGFAPDLDFAHRDGAEQKRLVAEKFASVGWETPRLLAALPSAHSFYTDVMAQVEMDSYAAGRVVLLGDAGYCPSPMSGQGTSLALVGAYVLAAELARTPTDHAAAFARYEERLRPFVAANQALATENPGGPPSDESLAAAKVAIEL